MYLPPNVLACIRRLRHAGFQAYAVGGCVRDSLLGIPPHDYDLCTDALPAQLCEIFRDHTLVRSGEKHGTVGVVANGQVIEITTFRTEGSYQDGRHPDWVRFVGSLQEDLSRRDFTVNAMAYSPESGYIDPWGGRQDLANRVLRTVGDPVTRFSEDALRILRGVRFAARFSLTAEAQTQKAMFLLAPTMEKLARERVFDELCKLLLVAKAQDLVLFAPVLAQAIPELQSSIGFCQHSAYHAYDVFTHTAHVVETVPTELCLRWAALLHDIGKPATFTMDPEGNGHFLGHAKQSAAMADAILLRLKAPNALRAQVVALVEQHMTPLEPDKRLLRRRLGKYGAEGVLALLTLQEADMGSKGTGKPQQVEAFTCLRQLLQEVLAEEACFSLKDLSVNGADLLALGYAPGPQLGACLGSLLEDVQDERLPNEKAALLQAAAKYREEALR